MTAIFHWPDIQQALEGLDIAAAMDVAFDKYSQGLAEIPPVGELLFNSPPGDAHIKYGCFKGDDTFLIKVATGFYENPKRNLPATSGMMLVFSQSTGLPEAILLDEGHLTNIRTAAAGASAARALARPEASQLTILGSGQQARLQTEHLLTHFQIETVHLWARRPAAVETCARDLERMGLKVEVYETPAAAAASGDIIVTTTASTTPLLAAKNIPAGAHITAMGSDTEEKRELTGDVLAKADRVVADSLSQCRVRGEISHAVREGVLGEGAIVELGDVIGGREQGRTSPDDITIADLTGVAVQDIAIAQLVLSRLSGPAATEDQTGDHIAAIARRAIDA